MSKVISPILASIADAISTPSEPRKIVLPHKERSKSGIAHKQPKPGKNKPAKNYNPDTKTWDK
jgi:hypothetical protein